MRFILALTAVTLVLATSLIIGAERTVAQRRHLAASFGRSEAQGPYVLHELASLTNRNWARVAGGDTNLPSHVNGHDEFAAAWQREMLHDLHGLPIAIVRQQFDTPGFKGTPANRPGVNIAVVVPGARHPNRAIVVGAHYDGEPTSKGSAYDDASGCAIMLGLARRLGAVWRKSGLPSLTVEFVLFDAEEQGLFGSLAYAYNYKSGAIMPRPVLMIDEEQSGVGYPVRPFGIRARAPLGSVAATTGRVPNFVQRILGKGPSVSSGDLTLLTRRLHSARHSTFGSLHSAYPSLPYRGGSASAFARKDEHLLTIGPVSLCCSDNSPFDALAVPTVTFAGDASFYEHNPPDWAYPFDQPQDTLTALACDTGGSPRPGRALAAALDLPVAMSAGIVAAYAAPARGQRPSLFSTLPLAGHRITFQIVGATGARLDFGDGSHAVGTLSHHIYRRAGTYRVTVRWARGHSSYGIVVHAKLSSLRSRLRAIDAMGVKHWDPPELRHVEGCH